MTVRNILAKSIAGACLVNTSLLLPGCDGPQAAPPPATSQTAPSVRLSTTSQSSNESARTQATTTRLSQPEPTANLGTTPPEPAAAAGDLPSIPAVALDAFPDRIRKKMTAARAAVDAAPGSSRAVCELGALYLAQNLVEPAAACFRRAIALVPNSSAPPYFLALALAQSGDDAGAIALFGDVIKYDPNYMPARIRQADLQYKTDKSKAAEMYRQAIEILPEAAFPHFRLGRCLMVLGRRDDAEKEFLKAVELQADYGDAHSALAELYAESKKTEIAERHRQLAATGKPSRGFSDPLYSGLMEVGRGGDFASNRAMSLAANGQIDQAIELLKSAAAREPDDMQCVATLATIHEATGNPGEAAQLWEQVYAIDPQWPAAAARLAGAYANSNRLPKAISTLKSHLRRAPEDHDARQALALMLAKNREPEAAIGEAEQAYKARGESAASLCQWAQVLIECNKLEDAAARLDKAQSMEPALGQVRLLRGMLFDRAGDAPKALAEFERVIEMTPDGLDGYIEGAKIAGQNRDWARQLRILKAGVDKKPNAPSLVAALAHLLSTCPDASIRDGKEAVKLAERICLATGMNNHAYLDILGEANAEAGEFEKASQTARQAIHLAKRDRQTDVITRYQVRLDLYNARKPYHSK